MDVRIPCWTCTQRGRPNMFPISEFAFHNKQFHSSDLVRCPHCPNCFHTHEEKDQHVATDHKKFICLQCTLNPGVEDYFDEDDFHAHYRKNHKRDNKVHCDGCPNRFADEKVCNHHKSLWHDYSLTPPQILCVNCGKFLPTKKAMLDHNAAKHKPKTYPFNCGNCNNVFEWESSRNDHVRRCFTRYE